MKPDKDSLLLIIAVIAVVVSLIGFGIVYRSVTMTGHATATGSVNVTVTTSALINFTTSNINFGSGKVDDGKAAALLSTSGTGSVTNGSWTPVSSGFIVENLGNVNVSLNISFGKTAATFIGGTNPLYQFNVTNVEAGSCTAAGGFNLGSWTSSQGSTKINVCNIFGKDDSQDTIRIDLLLRIPSDSYTGALGDVVTLNYEAV